MYLLKRHGGKKAFTSRRQTILPCQTSKPSSAPGFRILTTPLASRLRMKATIGVTKSTPKRTGWKGSNLKYKKQDLKQAVVSRLFHLWYFEWWFFLSFVHVSAFLRTSSFLLLSSFKFVWRQQAPNAKFNTKHSKTISPLAKNSSQCSLRISFVHPIAFGHGKLNRLRVI